MDCELQNRVVRITPPGSSAIAVIRVVGPKVAAFLTQHFSGNARQGRAVHGMLHDGLLEIDDPLVVRVSDTCADISVHASPWVITAAIGLAEHFGFTLNQQVRADHFGELDLIEAEVMAALPLARTELAVAALLAQPAAWARHSPSQDDALQMLLSLPTVALVGPANVGKSTLANALYGQARSIVSDKPGTTRDWVGAVADVNGLAVQLIDTPGARETNDPIERAAQAASESPIVSAHLVILVLDGSTRLGSDAHELMNKYPAALRVASKADLAAAWGVDLHGAVAVSAVAGVGMDTLRRRIARHFHCDEFDINRARCWTEAQRLRGIDHRDVLGAGPKQ